MAKVNVLRDALGKFRIGLYTEADVIRIFEQVVQRMANYLEKLEEHKYKLRQYKWQHAIEYEDLLGAIVRRIDERRWTAAIDLVGQAKALREEIVEAIAAIEALEEARELLRHLKIELGTKWIDRMPTILILEKALEEADRSLKRSEYQQALVFIRFCTAETKDAQSNDPEWMAAFKAPLLEQLEQMKQVCADTFLYSRALKVPDLEIQGKIEVLISELMEEGRIKLVKKLLDDLEFILKPRASFRDKLRHFPLPSKKIDQKIKTALGTDGWIGGANVLVSEKLQAFSGKLKDTEKLLDAAQSENKL